MGERVKGRWIGCAGYIKARWGKPNNTSPPHRSGYYKLIIMNQKLAEKAGLTLNDGRYEGSREQWDAYERLEDEKRGEEIKKSLGINEK